MTADREVATLVRAAAAGEQSGWDALVARFAGLVWNVARAHGLSTVAADDVALTTFLRFAEALPGRSASAEPVDLSVDVGPVLAAEARREALRALRWSDPRLDVRPRRPQSDDLLTGLEQLPARNRLTLRLLAVDGVSDEEVTAGLGASRETADALVADSLQRLAQVVGSGEAAPFDDLRSRLAAAVGEPPPASVLASARAAYSWRTPDGQLTPTSYDSLLDEDLTTVRSGSGLRLLTFSGGGLELDVEVGPDLLGRCSGVGPTVARIRYGGGSESLVAVDEDGRFDLTGLTHGPLSIALGTAGGPVLLQTEWVLV